MQRKRVNITNDVESRRRIQESRPCIQNDLIVKPEKVINHAESEAVQESPINESPFIEETPKKGRGKTKGDSEETQV